MRRSIAAIVAYFGLAVAALAQGVFPIPSFTIPIAGTVAASTRIVALPSAGSGVTKQIVVTQYTLAPVATGSVLFTAGTGTNCGTNTTNVTGTMVFSAGQALSVGDGNGVVLMVPQGSDLCITIATAAAPGHLAYTIQP